MTRKSPARRLVALVLLALIGYAGVVWAEESMRCTNCGDCSSSPFMCGLCIVEALRHDCGTYGPNAYCTCNNNVWDCFCDRP